MMRSSCRKSALIVATLALGGCGTENEPVSYSGPVAINLKAKSSAVVNATVTDDKSITTESGNPYGAFVNNARRELGGADPGRIELTSAQLLLGANTTGVTRLGEVFTGEVVVLFEMNDTGNSFPAASYVASAADGGGPLAFRVDFDQATMAAADRQKLLGGSFKVMLRGPAAPDFQTKGADADLQTTFTFSAFLE